MDDATKVDVTAEILAMRERFHAQQGGGLAFLAREVEQVMNDRAMLRAEVERLTAALAEARREGAREMRERCAAVAMWDDDRFDGLHAPDVSEDIEACIRNLPIDAP